MFGKQDTIGRKNFKSVLSKEDTRRKMEQQQQTLRLQKKEELVMKKRKEMEGSPSEKSDPNLSQKIQNIPKLVQLLQSDEKKSQLEATVQFRKLLSMERNPPIDEVIKAGVIPIFVKYLQRNDYPQLQFEAAWALTNIASGTSEHTEKVIQAGAVSVFLLLLSSSSDDVREQSVWALGNIAGDSPKCRNYVLQLGTLPAVIKVILENPKLSLLRNCTWTLSNLCRGKPIPDFQYVSPALSVLPGLLQHQDEEVLTDACWAVSYLSDGPNERIHAVLETGIVKRLVELLMYNQSTVQTPALRTIGNIVTGTDSQTATVINAGALSCLASLLNHTKKAIRKEACWTISNITAGNRDQIQAIVDNQLIPILAGLLGKDDFDVKKEACWAISNATSGGSTRQLAYLVEAGCIRPLCDILTIKDTKVVTVALEGLENILACGSRLQEEHNLNENPFVERAEEAQMIDRLEELQLNENQDIYDRSVKILEEYFGTEDQTQQSQNWNFGGQQAPQQGWKF